ncbi:MAG: hypothetical protein D6719_00240 [Candidatus Dadabacteria bacterium]|nr:MAG: hypothetical protein D6719_00240 [Candidatus Dadabacteria bacterium]
MSQIDLQQSASINATVKLFERFAEMLKELQKEPLRFDPQKLTDIAQEMRETMQEEDREEAEEMIAQAEALAGTIDYIKSLPPSQREQALGILRARLQQVSNMEDDLPNLAIEREALDQVGDLYAELKELANDNPEKSATMLFLKEPLKQA